MRLGKNGSHRVAKEIVDVIRANKDRKVKYKCQLKNKLIVLTYFLKLFLTLDHTIKLFYQTYLIYLMS